MTVISFLGSLPEVFLCTVLSALLVYGVRPNPVSSSIGVNGFKWLQRQSVRFGFSLPFSFVVTPLNTLEHDPAGKPLGTERHPFSFIDGPIRGFLEGRTAFQRRVWLVCLTLGRTVFLCYHAEFVTEITTFVYDSAASTVKGFIVFVGCVLIALFTKPTHRLYIFERVVLRMAAIAGLRFLVSAYDLIAFYLALELQSFCFYILAARKRESEFSTEAGIKYYRLGAFASGWILFGSAIIYGFTGTSGFEDLGNLLGVLCGSVTSVTSTAVISSAVSSLDSVLPFGGIEGVKVFGGWSLFGLEGVVLGRVFVRVGIFFKLAAAPFHLWAPDVYEGSPTNVTAFFAIVPKIAIRVIFFRLFFDVFEFAFISVTQPRRSRVAAFSRILGTLGALYQSKIKRLRAYSAIGHRGYRLMGFASGTLEGSQSVFLYRGIYRFTSLGFFAVLLGVKEVSSSRSTEDSYFSGVGSSEGRSLIYLSDLIDLGKSNLYLGVIISRLFFSRAGVPPLAGFFAKYYVFSAAVAADQFGLALLAVLTSTVGCFYYLRVIKLRYFTSPDASKSSSELPWPALRFVPNVHSCCVGAVSAFLILFCIIPGSFLSGVQKLRCFFVGD